MIPLSFYCYLIKCRSKPKHLLPFNFTNNKLKRTYISKMSNKVKEVDIKY